MRIFNLVIFISFALLLTGCNGQTAAIAVNKNKIGGVYEIKENGKVFKLYNGDQSFALDTLTFISFADFEKINREKSPYEGVYSLNFRLNANGTLKFKEMTNRNIRKQICFVMMDKVMAAPIVQSPVPNGEVSIMVADEKAVEELIEYLKN